MTPNFDRIAPLYRWLEYATLGPLLERTRLHHLPALAACRQAYILGDGDGRFTAALLKRYPTLHAHAVDLSPRMLALLRARTSSANLRITCADAVTLSPAPGTDLVVTHFFLDCLTQQQAETLISHIADSTPQNTLWLVSEFAIPTGLLHWPARLYIRSLYLAFRILTNLHVTRIPDYATPLARSGFYPLRSHRALFGLLTTTLWRKTNIQPRMTENPNSRNPDSRNPDFPDPDTQDPQSDPEPASPSLDAPDPAIFHPDPPAPRQN